MSDRPLVSLIVVTYNSATRLPKFFEALSTTRYSPYQVIVVDNASPDGAADYVAKRQPGVRLIANQQNVGFGQACNQGARAADGDFLVFLNPDVDVTLDWLDILVRHMVERPDAAIICPQTLYPDEPRTENQEPEEGSQFSVLGSATKVIETAAVPGAAMMVRRVAWQALGGFDERFFLYWEDTDLCWRAWLLGWRVLEDVEAHVYHERGGSGGGHWDAERTRNSLRTYLKTMRWRKVVPFAATLLAKTLAKLVLRRSPGLLGAWAWNWRHLGETLALRRELMRARRGDPKQLERLALTHARRGRAERQRRPTRT
jgi:N-acetylglucosaminyl-diphospho-decaprenol L-rhamnosyltransferase